MIAKAMKSSRTVGGAAGLGVASDVDCDMIRTLSRARLRRPNDFGSGAQPRSRGPWPPNPLFRRPARPVFLRQPSAPIFRVPGQPGYGDKWPS